MSLRFVHVIFIVASVAMAALVGGWGLQRFLSDGDRTDMGFSLLFFGLSLVLVVYGFKYFHKLKQLEGPVR